MNDDKIIIFGDTKNTEINDIYVEKLAKELRLQLGWEIKIGGEMYNHLREFSKLYSKDQRDIEEVAAIYRIAFHPGHAERPKP